MIRNAIWIDFQKRLKRLAQINYSSSLTIFSV